MYQLHVEDNFDQVPLFVDGNVEEAGEHDHNHRSVLYRAPKIVDSLLVEIKRHALIFIVRCRHATLNLLNKLLRGARLHLAEPY